MSGHTPDVSAIIESIPSRKVPAPVLFAGIGAMVLGVGGFILGLTRDPVWAWGALLVALVYTMALVQGGVIFSAISTLTWARWSQPLRRVAESFGAAWLVLYPIFLLFLVFGLKVFPWHPNTIVDGGQVSLAAHSGAVLFESKPFWLSPSTFLVRQAVGVLFLAGLSLLYIRASLRPDMILAKARLGDRAPAWWGSLIGGAGSLEAEIDKGQNRQTFLAGAIVITYAIVMSLVGFDLIMSLAPHWYSNMFGGWFASSSYWLSMQAIGLFSLVARDWLGLKGWIKLKTTHDLGKMILAFTMAWAYMTFAQLMPIWYTNMPEETSFLMLRFDTPWSWLTQTVAVMCFLMPFTVLVSRGIKKMRGPFAALLACMMTGVFLERTLLIMPSIYKGDTFPVADFLLVSIPVWLGMLGLFVTFVTQFISRVPTLPVSEPKLADHPWDVHAHSLDSHSTH